jgi:hypothetical protein
LDDELPDPDSVFRLDDAGKLDAASAHYLGDEDEDEGLDEDGHERAPPPVAGVLAGGHPVDHQIGVDEDTDQGSEDDDGPALDDTDAAEPVPEFVRESRARRTWVRVLLVTLAIGVLAITWAHAQHGKLLRHPTGAAVLGPIYQLLGMDVAPDWNPADYRAVQWEAVATADRPGTLTVAIDFLNAATFAQPYPIIRIVLEDRFGRRVGTHDVTPADYLEDYAAGSRLPAGRRVRTTVSVPDPGARADGFRVDFCLELHTRGLVCGPEPFR